MNNSEALNPTPDFFPENDMLYTFLYDLFLDSLEFMYYDNNENPLSMSKSDKLKVLNKLGTAMTNGEYKKYSFDSIVFKTPSLCSYIPLMFRFKKCGKLVCNIIRTLTYCGIKYKIYKCGMYNDLGNKYTIIEIIDEDIVYPNGYFKKTYGMEPIDGLDLISL